MARRKITKADVVEVAAAVDENLPELTPKEARFVEGLLEGKTAVEAYKGAYSWQDMKKTTVWAAASRTKALPKIEAWLRVARKAYVGTSAVTIDGHVRELERLRELALDSGNIGAAVQAEQLRGKAAGLYVERFENVTAPDPVKTLREISKISPEIAAALAARYGLAVEQPKQLEATDQQMAVELLETDS